MLQNFTEFMKILTEVFRGNLPDSPHYKKAEFKELANLALPGVCGFFDHIANSESPLEVAER
jgi:hypothetical protein